LEACQSREVSTEAGSGCLIRLACSSLLLRDCDEGALVYDEESGKTSLLNEQAGEVLRLLDSAAGQAEKDLRIALGMNDAPDAEPFQTLVSSLESSGLIVRC
jgi:PqqD family protein of HPr-rel-A system